MSAGDHSRQRLARGMVAGASLQLYSCSAYGRRGTSRPRDQSEPSAEATTRSRSGSRKPRTPHHAFAPGESPRPRCRRPCMPDACMCRTRASVERSCCAVAPPSLHSVVTGMACMGDHRTPAVAPLGSARLRSVVVEVVVVAEDHIVRVVAVVLGEGALGWG